MISSSLFMRRVGKPVSSLGVRRTSVPSDRSVHNGAAPPRNHPPPRPIDRSRESFCSQPMVKNEHHRPAHTPSHDNNIGIGRSRNRFAADWNATLAKHPQTVIATFLSTQSTTWLALYASLSAVDVALPPSLAAGWVAAKFTKKFRQPANAALAAVLVRWFPALSEVKVTPLVTGFVMGDKDKKVISNQIDENAPSVKPIVDGVVRGARWLEGPIDKYGLSYYVSSRISGVVAIGVSSCLVHQGVDISAYLSEWGVGQGVGDAVGTAAAAAMCNIWFLPLHFYASVYGVRSLDRTMHEAARITVGEKLKAEREFRGEYGQDKWNHDGERSDDDEGYRRRESEYERISDGAMRSATMLLLAYSLMVSMYSFRLLGETATASSLEQDDAGENKSDGINP